MISISSQPLMESVRSHYLFEHFPDAEFATVCRAARKLTLAEKECLFSQGDPAEYFYLMQSGQIKLFLLSEQGDEKVVDLVNPGQAFAEAVMFMRGPVYPVHAEALVPCQLYAFNMETFRESLKHSVESCFDMLAAMSRRVHQQLGEIDNLTLQNATYRLVNFLLGQIPEGVLESPQVHLNTPKNVIASRLSIQPETLSRILSRLHKRELLDTRGSTILLRDIEGLRALLH